MTETKMPSQYIKVELYKQCRPVKKYFVDRSSYVNGNSNDSHLVTTLLEELGITPVIHKDEPYELGAISFDSDLYISELTYYHDDQNYPEDDLKGY